MSDYISFQDILPNTIVCRFQLKELKITDDITLSVCILKVSGIEKIYLFESEVLKDITGKAKRIYK